jgi:PDZ domain-containing secreted protein
MKKGILKFGLFSMVLLGLVSCKNDEKELADKRISELESYVDSLKTVAAADMESNWDQIAADFDRKSTEANAALTNLDEETRNASQQKIDAARSSYDGFKVTLETKAAETKVVVTNPNQMLRDRFFGAGKVGEDMNFSWVNKDNILSVYDAFFQSYKDNKENFTREDYDEVKLMYEALDSRKNTVEKEGLSSEDNGKIASIKFKFGPMFKMNRIGAKSRETAEAKE